MFELNNKEIERLANRQLISNDYEKSLLGDIEQYHKNILKQLIDIVPNQSYIVEDGLSGISSYIEIQFKKSDNVLSVRKCLFAPYAAIGEGAFTVFEDGNSSCEPLTLNNCGIYNKSFKKEVDDIKLFFNQQSICILNKRELEMSLPKKITVFSCLLDLENRNYFTFYDLLFQWED